MASSRKDWSIKVDETLEAYRTIYKTPIAISPFQLIYGKACHLPVELEYKSYWALKTLNLYSKVVGLKRKLQIQELKEMRLNAYCAGHSSVLGSNSAKARFLGRAGRQLGCWAWVKFA